ncbi:hypothetical protein K1T71_013613 [Dendrolimus kikuchii]|uniref:Uncharacterized protein n=1 Tax=Dendrolimus kikuchii TaxID=765133 RepID=A0ACC1CH70_9NEOP|nr:hypothetical protein K1T71_013613 [Dendrolimus kikuchii]
MILFALFLCSVVIKGDDLARSREILEKTRRILHGREVGDTRSYMVYLRPATTTGIDTQVIDANWLCGGVIIHEHYILTSAACIENVKHFYVISGTHRWIPLSQSNDCIKNGAKKAVWKCVPKSYFYDGNDFDNIRWMANDIAVVKTEDDFNFQRRVRGCDFIPKKVAYNDQSRDLEKGGTLASTAGWGSVDKFSDAISRTTGNSPVLLETDVILLSKKKCKKRWDPRYHYIIDDYMVCGKDSMDVEAMSSMCSEHEINCKELVYSEEDDDDDSKPSPTPPEIRPEVRRMIVDPLELQVHRASHFNDTRRHKVISAGFCENDHGGPLVVGQGKTSIVVGIISACQTKELNHKCYGPFLYTSVYNNRNLINCAINKDIGATCRKLLRSSKTQMVETIFNWPNSIDSRPLLRTEDKLTSRNVKPVTRATTGRAFRSITN